MSKHDDEGGLASEIDTAVVRALADILRETELTCIEVERGELKIRVERQAAPASHPAPATYAAYAPAVAPSSPAQAFETSSASAAVAPPATPARRDSDLVKSPMVGTVYLQAQPGAPAFAKVGDQVTAGQTLFIIEAMKTMNPVPATKAGKVVEVLIADGQPVEFGQPLAVVA